jgi:hypothetical protein
MWPAGFLLFPKKRTKSGMGSRIGTSFGHVAERNSSGLRIAYDEVGLCARWALAIPRAAGFCTGG